MGDLVLSTTNNPGNANWVDIDSLVTQATIVIPDGGSIGGVYEANILCLGSVYITADLSVSGDLIVKGNVYVANPTAIFVQGDFICGSQVPDPFSPPDYMNYFGDIYIINGVFNSVPPVTNYVDYTTTGTAPQKDIVVCGDFRFNTLSFPQTGNAAAQLRVLGNFTGYANCSSNDTPSNYAPGAIVYVRGHTAAYIEATGSPQGGSLYLQSATGTFSVSGSYNVPGNGGYISASSMTAFNVYANGSTAYNPNPTDSDGGDGGNIYVSNLSAYYINASGGSCESPNADRRAGLGGSIVVNGVLTVDYLLALNGGGRLGSVSYGSGSLFQSNAGFLQATSVAGRGSLTLNGGDVVNSGLKSHNAGSGGTAYFGANSQAYTGDITAALISMTGGDDVGPSTQLAGNGGFLIGGRMTIAGFSNSYVLLRGGGAIFGTSGNGGYMSCLDAVVDGYIDVSSQATSGSAGNAGTIVVRAGNLHVDSIIGNGGNCTSTNNTHRAGAGASIQVLTGDLYTSFGPINISAGNRSGNTTSAAANLSPSAGTLQVQGNCHVYANGIQANGSAVTTFYPWGSGGRGGSITVYGFLSTLGIVGHGNVELKGGNSAGAVAGNGGVLSVGQPFNNTATVTLVGGNSVASGSGSAASTPGRGGDATFYAGAVIDTFTAANGTGTGSPASNPTLLLAGACSFNSLDMPTSGLIQPIDGTQNVMLKVNTMPTKTTFNNTAGTPTASQAANLASNLFFTGASGAWYRIAATAGPL